jgi:resuscitation-promoting factor RpfA
VEGPKARRVLTLLVAGEAIAVGALHRLGGVDGFAIPRRDVARWLRQTPSEEVLLAGIRLAALIAAWWLLASTLLYVAARLARLHRTARALGLATLPAVRHWADRAAAVSIVAASALGAARPAGADPQPTTSPTRPPVVIEVDHRDHRPPMTDRAPLPSTTAVPPAPSAPPVAAPAPAPSPVATHVVAPGEHLWSIAAAHVAASTGRRIDDLTAAEIAPYWSGVVEINRARLRSGNPDLVYPGEVIELPPL